MTLAVCMIVRNEADRLARCLESVTPIADAVYVTDTGSDDKTVEIARRCGCDVRHFKWEENFSAARNASIRNVKEDWLLCLDADDILTTSEGRKLRETLPSVQTEGCTLRHSIMDDYSPVESLKLFRNHRGLLFEGIIHEHLRGALRDIGGTITSLNVRLRHEGYESSMVGKKMARNRPLLERELERSRQAGDWEQYFYVGGELGLALHHLGDSCADVFLNKLLEELRKVPADWRRAWDMQILGHLVWILQEKGKFHAALEIARDVEDLFANEPAYLLYRGLAATHCGIYAEGVKYFREFEEKQRDEDRSVSLPRSLLEAGRWTLRGHCHMGLHQFREAIHCFQRCVDHEPGVVGHRLRLQIAHSMAGTFYEA